MDDHDNEQVSEPQHSEPEKPCVALMGEFSAGKSTLSNLLIGAQSLPVQVTATQLPPVWISYGDQPPYRVDLDGNVEPIDLNQLANVVVSDTSYIRIFRKSPVLDYCDIIDMPGISDPSMAAEVWQRAIHHATTVVWCSHATQAWRQSEAAVWDSLPPTLYDKSILLLTRMDKITKEHDRERVLRRVQRETAGLFAEVMPISLLQAIEAGDDAAAWKDSGAEAFIDCLIRLTENGEPRPRERASERPSEGRVTSMTAPVASPAQPEASVLPRRVVPRTGIRAGNRRSERPSAQAAGAR